jgi:hypothetical protein
LLLNSAKSCINFRHVKSSYFNVGDLILYGKYKNKRGKIVGFGLDEKKQQKEPVPFVGEFRRSPMVYSQIMGTTDLATATSKGSALAAATFLGK